MTTQEIELVEYLKEHPVVLNNTVLAEKGTFQKTLSYLIENEITILSLSFVTMSENGVEKTENAIFSYQDKEVSLESMIEDVVQAAIEFTHVEISVRLKNQP